MCVCVCGERKVGFMKACYHAHLYMYMYMHVYRILYIQCMHVHTCTLYIYMYMYMYVYICTVAMQKIFGWQSSGRVNAN